MLFSTTGNASFLFFQMMMMVLLFLNIAKIVTWVLWINVNPGLFIFLHWNPCIFEEHRRPFYWPRSTGNQTFLFHIWVMVGPKLLLSWVGRICLLIITTSPTDLKLLQNIPNDHKKVKLGLAMYLIWPFPVTTVCTVLVKSFAHLNRIFF